MLNEDNVERFWDVCDDLGIAVTEIEIQSAWAAYCNKHQVAATSDLPLNTGKLFEVVKESLSLVGVGACVVG